MILNLNFIESNLHVPAEQMHKICNLVYTVQSMILHSKQTIRSGSLHFDIQAFLPPFAHLISLVIVCPQNCPRSNLKANNFELLVVYMYLPNIV